MAESFLDRMQKTSHLAGGNVAYIEAMYESFLADANSVPEEWRSYFERLPRVDGVIGADIPHSTIRTHFEMLGRNRLRARPETVSTDVSTQHEQKQMRVTELISAYRHRGHKRANIDPLGLMQRPPAPVLDLAYHHLSEADMDTVFQTGSFFYGAEKAKLRDIVAALEKSYCGSVGAEYMHIVDAAEQIWVQQRIESVRAAPEYSAEVKRMVLERLTAAEGLEKYLAQPLSRYQAFWP
jgi:2-oxoglutarate dehydrogenase E1 component